jgi:hypothetical protein
VPRGACSPDQRSQARYQAAHCRATLTGPTHHTPHTTAVHHARMRAGKHHRAYVDNMNKQIVGTPLEGKTLEEVVMASWNGGAPTPVFNNAAQVRVLCGGWCRAVGGRQRGVGNVVLCVARCMYARACQPPAPAAWQLRSAHAGSQIAAAMRWRPTTTTPACGRTAGCGRSFRARSCVLQRQPSTHCTSSPRVAYAPPHTWPCMHACTRACVRVCMRACLHMHALDACHQRAPTAPATTTRCGTTPSSGRA